jgi:RNA polymerase sigma-70 factor (ECF subfamily)
LGVTAGDITRLLADCRAGNPEAASKLIPLVYGQLRRLAAKYLRSERPDHTLQPTAVVNDALLSLLGSESIEWHNRAHFFAVAASAMRRILIDHARGHRAKKRGGQVRIVRLEDLVRQPGSNWGPLLELDEALTRLEKKDGRLSKVVEMRFFGGMSEEETATVLGVSVRTVKRDWRVARAWLYGEITKT